MDKPKCSGIRCIMNRNFKPEDCELFDQCDYYTASFPISDMSRMESVIDMAVKQFRIDEADRGKLEILFNAYVAEYMRLIFRI